MKRMPVRSNRDRRSATQTQSCEWKAKIFDKELIHQKTPPVDYRRYQEKILTVKLFLMERQKFDHIKLFELTMTNTRV